MEATTGTPTARHSCNSGVGPHFGAAEIEAHSAPDGPHARGACGPVCTFGDW